MLKSNIFEKVLILTDPLPIIISDKEISYQKSTSINSKIAIIK